MNTKPPFKFSGADWQISPGPGADGAALRLNSALEHAYTLNHYGSPAYVLVAVLRQVMVELHEKHGTLSQGPRMVALQLIQDWTAEPLAQLQDFWLNCSEVLPDKRPRISPPEFRTLDYDPFSGGLA